MNIAVVMGSLVISYRRQPHGKLSVAAALVRALWVGASFVAVSAIALASLAALASR